MQIIFDSLKSEHKTPFGCVRQGEKCAVTIYVPNEYNTLSVAAVIYRDDGFSERIPLYLSSRGEDYEHFRGEFSLSECGLYFYYFEIETPASNFSVFRNGRHGASPDGNEKWQITCFAPSYDTPPAFKGCVMYQIFPDRFFKSGDCDTKGKLTPFYLHENTRNHPQFEADENGKVLNNDFYGGNLRGICEKLGYLAQLGVNVIYLNPIFKAFSNHRYDTADYKTVDPLLGTNADFRTLCEKAHSLGIKVLLDGVFSHTGDNSIYFDRFGIFGNGAVSNPSSPYKSWYDFSDYPSKYTSWWGIESLPCVNEMEESYIDFIINSENSVINKWLSLGADGFRLDVADELPDEFIALLHKKVKEIKPGALIIGEVWEDASNKISYGIRRKYFACPELDSVMNYPFKNVIISYALGEIGAQELSDRVLTICENYPKPVLDCLMNILSTHDTARILTVLGRGDFSLPKREKSRYRLPPQELAKALELERLCAFLQFTLPGSACIYYGDEIGMQGFEDPFNREFFSWDDKNKSLLSFYTALSEIKNKTPALKTGGFSVLECATAFVAKRESLLIITNTTDVPYEIKDAKNVLFSQNTDLFSSYIAVRKNGFALIDNS